MSNGRTDWHHIWYTYADSSGNGWTPNNLARETQGGTWGRGLVGQTFKSQGKLSNGWTDWHQLWFTSADSSGNGHRLNTSRPSIPRGHVGGGVRGYKLKKVLGSCQTAGPTGTRFGTHLWIHLGMDIGSKQFAPGRYFGWFYGVNKSKYWEMWSNGWTD